MKLYDLISRIKAAETDADSVAILEEELIRIIEETKPTDWVKQDMLDGYQFGIDKYQSNLLKLLTKEN